MIYKHTADMDEISGFGGGYEQACQDMLNAGVQWLQAHPKADLQGRTYQGVYGILEADSDDAKAIETVILAVCDGCSGAMHQAVMSRLFYIASNGWDAYCTELRKRKASVK